MIQNIVMLWRMTEAFAVAACLYVSYKYISTTISSAEEAYAVVFVIVLGISAPLFMWRFVTRVLMLLMGGESSPINMLILSIFNVGFADSIFHFGIF